MQSKKVTNNPIVKKKLPVKKIVLIIVGALVAVAVVVGVIFGINMANEAAKLNDYRSALNEMNSVILKYNELSGLESVALAQSTDEEAIKTAASNDVTKIQAIIDFVTQKIDTLANEKVFSGDDSELNELFSKLQDKKKDFTDFYRIAIEAYQLKATGDFNGAKDKMMSGTMTADSEFVSAMNELNKYLQKKANNQ